MNVIVINGSPKCGNSNTMKLTRAFLDGAGWTDIDIIDVQNKKINGCLGCYSCWKNTPGKCVISDDMDEILQKFIHADIIIWSFPLYVYNVPGKMKCLIDRRLPLSLPFMSKNNESGGHPPRYDLSDKRNVVVSTCGFWTAEGNYDGVKFLFDRILGQSNYELILCGQGELFRVDELKNLTDGYLEIVNRAGGEFVRSGIKQSTKDELSKPLLPRDVFEKAADASWGIEASENKETAVDDGSLKSLKQMAAFYKTDGVERVLEFHFTDIQKTYQILLTKSGAVVTSENFVKYTTKIEVPFTLWRSISKGEISGQEALFQGKYKVLGDMDVMIKWNTLFNLDGSSDIKSSDKISDKTPHKTNMRVLLTPWIIIWVFMAINGTAGGIAGIIAAACIPLLWLIYKPVLYERITAPVVAGLSLAVLLGADVRIVLSASYGLFGLIWLVSTFTKIPLTAYYSAYAYDGEAMFGNPIFMKTNRILTAAWGVLYLITTFLAYIIMGTVLLPYTGLITSIIPIGMGLFTAWFVKWYPERCLAGK